MTKPAELHGRTQEELRFWRLIDHRWQEEDGSQTLMLACCHESTVSAPIPDTQQYAPCDECIRLFAESEAKFNSKFVLNENNIVLPEPDTLTWAHWFENAYKHGKLTVAFDEVGEYEISTVFKGTSTALANDASDVFETAIFEAEPRRLVDIFGRCGTWDEAVAMHEQGKQCAVALGLGKSSEVS